MRFNPDIGRLGFYILKKVQFMKKVKVIVVGCGNMGSSHARAYDKLDEFEIVGIVDANPKAVETFNASVGKQYPYFSDFD